MTHSVWLHLRRGDTPFFAFLRRKAFFLLNPEVPVPLFLLPLIRPLFTLHWTVWRVIRTVIAVCYNSPLFRSRCESAGRGLFVWLLPHVKGHTRIYVGDHLTIHGKIGITSGRICDQPTLRIGNNVTIGHMVSFIVNREIVLEDGVLVAGRCTLADSDGHPRDSQLRALGLPPAEQDIKPVRICRNAWIGEGAQIRKGVTIGEGAIVGAAAVVLKDVPPNCIVIGNPAKVVGFSGRGNEARSEQ